MEAPQGGAPPAGTGGRRTALAAEPSDLRNGPSSPARVSDPPATSSPRVIHRRRPQHRWSALKSLLDTAPPPATRREIAAWRHASIERNGLERLQGGTDGFSRPFVAVTSVGMPYIGPGRFDLHDALPPDNGLGATASSSGWAIWCAVAPHVSVRRPGGWTYGARPGLPPDDKWRRSERWADLCGHRGRRNANRVEELAWQDKLRAARRELKLTRKFMREKGLAAYGFGGGAVLTVSSYIKGRSEVTKKPESNRFGMGERIDLEKWVKRRITGAPAPKGIADEGNLREVA